MACLGGRAELGLLQAATGEPADVVEQRLAPALEDGLLVMEPGARPAVRFRHDRVREAVLRRAGRAAAAPGSWRWPVGWPRVPELFAVAAEQYLPVADAVDEPGSGGGWWSCCGGPPTRRALIGDYALVNALLTAALPLVDPADGATLVEVRTRRHAALFSLGRLDEADEEYRGIEAAGPDRAERADATAVQVRSLSHRTRFAEAIALGLRVAARVRHRRAGRRTGSPRSSTTGSIASTGGWTAPARPTIWRAPSSATPRAGRDRLIDAVLPVAYFVADRAMIAWLGSKRLRIWTEHGPSRSLVGPVAPRRLPRRPAARRLPRRRTGRCGASWRSARPAGTSPARHRRATWPPPVTGWFEPIEHGVARGHRARDGLIAGGDLAYAGYTYLLSVPYWLDCAPSLDELRRRGRRGAAFLRRTGNEQTGRGSTATSGWSACCAASARRGERGVPLDRYADDPPPLIYAHLCRAIAAAVFGDPAGLAQHSAAAMALLPVVAGFYPDAEVRLLRGLALAEEARARTVTRARSARRARRADAVAGGCAADAPDNFLHLLRLVEAERAWAVGDFRAAVLAFDAARREVAGASGRGIGR